MKNLINLLFSPLILFLPTQRMEFRQKLASRTGLVAERLPSSYQMVGDVMLLRMLRVPRAEKKNVAVALLRLFPRVKTVCELKGIEGEFRTPRVRKLAGNGTVTVHKEHGIAYKLDAARLMFSKGNLAERKRLITLVRANETVVDMFAGIGYFSLGIAKFGTARKIYAAEKNAVAYRYLKRNIALNRIKNIEPLCGDSRALAAQFRGTADRVLMGYFPGTERFLPAALMMLKRTGVIHYHNTYHEHELWKKPLNDIRKHVPRFRVLRQRKVKSTAPRTYHVVLDIEVLQ